MPLDEKIRTEFVDSVLTNLELQNYGFIGQGCITKDEIMSGRYEELFPLKQLLVKLKIYSKSGKEYDEKIDFPKGKRTIICKLSNDNIANNIIRLKPYGLK